MSMLIGTRRALLGGRKTYIKKVMSLGPIAYWVQNEGAGLTAIDQVNSPAQDGTYTGITWPAPQVNGPWGEPSPFYDGTNDYTDIWSVPFRDAFNGSEGSASAWVQVSAAGIWGDGTVRHPLTLLVDANNNILFPSRQVVNNQLRWQYDAGGVIEQVFDAALGAVDAATGPAWIHTGLTWSASADEVRAYGGGAQTGATQVGLGIWAGQLLNVQTLIGAVNQAPNSVWSGYIRDVAIFDYPLLPSQMAELARA